LIESEIDEDELERLRDQLLDGLDRAVVTRGLPPPTPAERRRRGLVGRTRSWALEHPRSLDQAVRALLGRPVRESPFLGALLAVRVQLAGADFFVRSPPLIVRTPGRLATRYGFFHWATDRDAFIEQLLGKPVPRRPRYAAHGPRVAAEMQEEGLAAALEATAARNLRGRSRDSAATEAYLLRALARALATEPGLGAAIAALVGIDPGGFVHLPLGRRLLDEARGTKRSWRLSGDDALEFAWLEDAGEVGYLGLAWWLPGETQLRRERATMAAHLRYLFDSYVAPWNRFRNERARREAAFLFAGRRGGGTIEAVAEDRRRRFPELYADEPCEVTVRRLRRINPQIHRPVLPTPASRRHRSPRRWHT